MRVRAMELRDVEAVAACMRALVEHSGDESGGPYFAANDLDGAALRAGVAATLESPDRRRLGYRTLREQTRREPRR